MGVAKQMFNVSQSKVQQWRRCRYAHFLAHVRRLSAKKKAKPLYFGTAVHAMLEAVAKGKDARSALAEIAYRDEKLFRGEEEAFARVIEDISYIMRAYKKYWSDAPLQLVKIQGQKAEVQFAVEIDDGITCKGKIDGLVEHKKMNWLLEHKTHKEFPNADHRWRNLQSAVYITIAKLIKWPRLQGVCWNYIRSKEPTRPKLMKKSTALSKAAIDTLPEVITDAIEEHKLNPADYEDVIQLQEENLQTWFERIYQPVQKGVVEQLWDEFLVTSREMADYYAKTDKPPARTIDLHCSWCEFEKICRAELQGSDIEWVIEKEYVQREGDYQ